MLFVAEFANEELPDVIVDADTSDEALEMVAALGLDEAPIQLVVLPKGIFSAEVQWNESDDDGEPEFMLAPFEQFDAWVATRHVVRKAQPILPVEVPTAPKEPEGGE